MNEKKFLDLIDAIPGEDGWWKTGTRQDYRDVAAEMVRAGMKENRVVELLQRLYVATADCFGS